MPGKYSSVVDIHISEQNSQNIHSRRTYILFRGRQEINTKHDKEVKCIPYEKIINIMEKLKTNPAG